MTHRVKKPAIIAFAPGDWRWPELAGSPRYHLWTLSKRGWPVVFMDAPRQLTTRHEIWRADDRPFYAATSAYVPPFGFRRVFHQTMGNAWRWVTSVRWAERAHSVCTELGIKPGLFWFGAPWHGTLSRLLPHNVIRVSHVNDELPESPALSNFQKKTLWNWEKELLRSCAVCFCSSVPQLNKRKGLANQTVLLQNAVSESFFEPGAPSSEALQLVKRLEKIPRPRIVYGGVADQRLDGDLLISILERIPQASLVFLGAKAGTLDERFTRIAELSHNAYFFGGIPYNAYPHLYSMADALILAHKIDPFTKAMYSAKLNEYLASGKPIVSVPLPEVERISAETGDDNAIRIARSTTEFTTNLEQALSEEDERMSLIRRATALNHTWEKEADVLEQTLLSLIRRR